MTGFLKALDNNDRSSAIVLAFQSRSVIALERGLIQRVFRKVGPQSADVRCIYVYAGRPRCGLVGRLPVLKIERLALPACLSISEQGGLAAEELKRYAGGRDSLFSFTVGLYERAIPVLDLAYLKLHYGFYPPQNFMVLSKNGVSAIESSCVFNSA